MKRMAKRNQSYRPLVPARRFGLGRTRAWRSDDHLLIVEANSFHEYYTRLYWADIQSILLYSLLRRTVLLDVLEVACVLAAMWPSLALWKAPWSVIPAALFAGFYVTWRFLRPNWACQMATRTNSKRFAIPGTLVECRRVLNELKQFAATAQSLSSEQTTTSDTAVTASQILLRSSRPREPMLALHVIAFVLGLFSPFHIAIFVFYCISLAVAYFVGRDFEFPLAVRSAAVLSQMLAATQIAFWILANTRLSFVERLPLEYWQFVLPRLLVSLYGVAAVYWVSIEQRKPQRQASTVLGLS